MAKQIIRIGARGGKIVSDKGGGKVTYQGKDDDGQQRMGASVEGDAELAAHPRGNPADFHALRSDPRYPAVGAKSVVSAGGQKHTVTFHEDHVEYNGEKWHSLMRLRTAIRPSSKKGGWAFFGLHGEAAGAGKVEAASKDAPMNTPKASGWEAWRAKHPDYKVMGVDANGDTAEMLAMLPWTQKPADVALGDLTPEQAAFVKDLEGAEPGYKVLAVATGPMKGKGNAVAYVTNADKVVVVPGGAAATAAAPAAEAKPSGGFSPTPEKQAKQTAYYAKQPGTLASRY